MLSVCIPVYRYHVRPLVQELLTQVAGLEEEVELLVYDDASPEDGDWGREELRKLPGLQYVELSRNVGRAAIRNKMAREASHPYLLLMDADGQIPPRFLLHYVQYLTATTDGKQQPQENIVLVGGRKYASQPPPEAAFSLHWWYGTQRESRTLTRRKKEGWLGFQSNNFVISRSLLRSHPFPEGVAGYGHEDTLWGQQLLQAGIPIHHVDNPVLHLGLEPNDVFLHKQREAIRNLALLQQRFPHLRTRLLELVARFPWAARVAKAMPEPLLVSYLTSRPRPSLYALDALKLRWWEARD